MPGIGPRSAERIALWIVRAQSDHPEQISRAIADTRQAVHPCALCGFFTTDEVCDICADSSRLSELLCVVEQPTDILPLEHVGPEHLLNKEFGERLYREKNFENIFALPPHVEGEATTNYLVDLL